MEKSNDKQKNQQQDLQLELKNLGNLPGNIKLFQVSAGTLVVAVDQADRAIALAYVPK